MSHKEVIKAIKGDEEAFESLIKEEGDKMYKTAFLYVRNKDDALDVVQETVTKAFISIHQLKKPELFSAWLMKILIHTAYDLLHKKNKVVLTDNFSSFKGEQRVGHEEKLDLLSAISKLTHNYKTVIILFYFQDQSIKSISESMDKPEGTIKTYLHRAKSEIKKLLGGVDLDEKRMV
ncbi:sigma-70 family RNA polymerase sigma factor [Virgibacillus halodenitrificans]|uniref:sigma-70 family RNA polymerase sigma factor n=1 Tax=Virgibacillus halodenitrificans TaxID=1482 RepID=UPI000EF4E368|nr:sigma-70 family RNA polymerase sigma factor [Virgibacillus halodenitrificans]